MKRIYIICLLLFWCVYGLMAAVPKRIITLSGALTETVDALGLGKQIVATDVTSIFPAFVKLLPKVSRNRSFSAEGLMAFAPDLVLAPEGDISKEIQYQLKTAGIRLVNVKQEYTAQGALRFIKDVATAVGIPKEGEVLANKTNSRLKRALEQVKARQGKKPKVLFIYARGTGTMSVAGKGSNMDAIISLAGGRNAILEFSDFKPYTTEALVKANPDIILMFDFGLSSLGGKNSVLRMPGIQLTNAGKSKRIIEMDGQLLINFSVRLPDAIMALNERL